MNCPSCGAHNILGAEQCVNCGTDLSNIILTTPAPEFVRAPASRLAGGQAGAVGPTDPVALAVSLMQREASDCVLVLEGEDLVGILTTWDILHKVAGPKEDLNAVTCGEIMTKDPVFLRDEDDIAVAINKMATGEFRHIPLLENGRVRRVISAGDLFRYVSPHLT
jgi:CBS domain-containing protein